MLGLIALTWAPIPIWAPVSTRMVIILEMFGVGWVWLLWWFTIGVMLIAGSIWPFRKCRMMALGLSAIGWFSFFVMYLWDWSYSPSTLSMLVYGVMSVITLTSDVRGKPRVARS